MNVKKLAKISLVTGLLFCFSGTSYAGMICKLDELIGFENSKKRALQVIKTSRTTDFSKLEVYVEMTKDGPYFHSNYKDSSAEYVTKIGGFTELDNLKRAIDNFSNENLTDSDLDSILSKTKVYLDKSVFNLDGSIKIDLNGASNVFVVTEDKPMDVRRHVSENGKVTFFSRIRGCCFLGIPPQSAVRLKTYLEDKIFKPKSIKFLSIVNDTATDDQISQSKLVSKAQKKGTFFGLLNKPQSSADDILKVIRSNTNKTVVLLGHREGNQFVKRDAMGKVEFSIGISAMHEEAKNHNVLLIALGCNTGEQVGMGNAGVGTLSYINTIDMVSKIDLAFEKSENYADFFDNITDENSIIVASPNSVEQIVELNIYDDTYSELNSKIAATIYIMGLSYNIFSIDDHERCSTFNNSTTYKKRKIPNIYNKCPYEIVAAYSNKIEDK